MGPRVWKRLEETNVLIYSSLSPRFQYIPKTELPALYDLYGEMVVCLLIPVGVLVQR